MFAAKQSLDDDHEMDTTAGSVLSSSVTSDEGGMMAGSGTTGRPDRRSSKLDDIDEDDDDVDVDDDDDDEILEDEEDAAAAAAIMNIEARLDKALSDVNAMTVDRLASSLSKSLVTGDMPDQEKEQLFASLTGGASTPPSSLAPTSQQAGQHLHL